MFSPEFLEFLRDPPKSYRPIPFWSWNELLDTTETRRQIDEMDRVGIGGYFMHARGGLQTPYMEEDWMANIRAGIEEGRKRGMGAWAYDENGWPSGFGNGIVNGKGLRYQQKYLRWEDAEEASEREDRTITEVTLADGRRLRFTFDVNPFYVDTLDPEVTAEFLREIYTPYAERFGADFGGAMPGFFTDEPQVSRNGIPWSFILPEAYREAYGEELLPLLPALFFEEGDWQRTRYRFWFLVQELFVTGFTEQIHRWCEEHHCGLTGHMVLEESLHSQLTSNGAVMPHYEFFHIPGMDWLGRHIDPPTTPLQVASVAHQLGLPRVLSETFALTGWNVSFQELKWMFEWQMVRGVTLLCQHLEGYSLRGIRKRDYPPSLFFQQPWWEDYRRFNDAMSRVGMLLSRGETHFDILVLHPQSSAWLDFDQGANAGIQRRFEEFLGVIRALEHAHVLFDIGDERIMKRHGRVEKNKLRIGKAGYGTIVVPAVTTLAASTVALLEEFTQAGGCLLWCGTQPTLVEGEEGSESLLELTGRGVAMSSAETLVDALPAATRRFFVRHTADGSPATNIAVTERHFSRRDAGVSGRLFYAVHQDPKQDIDLSLDLPGGSACRIDIETGQTEPLVYARESGRLTVPWNAPAAGSLLLFVHDDPDTFPAAAAPSSSTRKLDLADPERVWERERLDPNALTLDTCDVFFDGELIAEQAHISIVQKRALDLERPVDIALRFTVQCAPGYTPPDDVCLVLETPERYALSVNGNAVPMHDAGPYRDTSFRRIPLAGSLKEGSNELLLTTRFHQPPEVYENLRRAKVFEAEKNKLSYDSEIEAVYLVGDFGVATPGTFEELPRSAMRYDGPFLLCPPVKTACLGDLTRQGLPFFNGTVVLRTHVSLSAAECQNRHLEVAEVAGHVLRLRVNGREVGVRLWGPYRFSLDGLLREGENCLEFELTGGLRNLLGPHHLQEGESYAVGPGSFFKEPNIWGSPPWDDRYCFVQFGLRL